MGGKIPAQFIDDLLSRIDIVEVIGARLALKKAGRNLTACCPFHSEKTPSFTVSPEKQFYHCFGCGAHGTALGFLMHYERLDFPEAVQDLAHRAGVELPRGNTLNTLPTHEDLYPILQRAAEYYRRQWREHPGAERAIGYLKSRGVSGSIAAAFNLGFAPPGWNNLSSALCKDDACLDQLRRAGLVIDKSGGGCYDRFRDRIIFPIHDRRGRVLGFGGRVLDDTQPKYLNSPETPVFHKGRHLYALHSARPHAPAFTLVVEGYMDVIALAQYGIDYAVACLGTAITGEHTRALFQSTPAVVFCFDGDRAGRAAAWRALELCLPVMNAGREARFLFLPDGEDPDSLVRKEGKEAFEQRLTAAVPLSTFFYEELSTRVDMATMDGRARLVESAKPLLRTLPEGIFKVMMTEQLAQLTSLAAQTLLLNMNADKGQGRSASNFATVKHRNSPGRPSLVRRTLEMLLHDPALAQHCKDTAWLHELQLPGVSLLRELLDLLNAEPHLKVNALIERWRDRPDEHHLAKLAQWMPQIPDENLAREFQDALIRLQDKGRQQRGEPLGTQVKSMGADRP